MLLQSATRPGWTIGVNGLAGNLGVARRRPRDRVPGQVLRLAHGVRDPGRDRIACGIAFAACRRTEAAPPAQAQGDAGGVAAGVLARVLLVMTLAATSGSLLFNFSTNGNYELLHERFATILAGSGARSARCSPASIRWPR